ncbi:MAG: hypothetical protein H6Q74_2922 [Firmicutes bacterium]|nr:hypothetical protein [Bacillota bacterium]
MDEFKELDLAVLDLVIIENDGNLMCSLNLIADKM